MVQEDVGKLRCITFTDNRLNDRLVCHLELEECNSNGSEIRDLRLLFPSGVHRTELIFPS